EVDTWSPLPPDEPGNVSRFGSLTGLVGLEPRPHVFFVPYGLARATLAPESDDGEGGAGLEVRTVNGGSQSARAVFNPDFGQVEADPAEVNLSVFETQFPEKRPFFVESQQDLQTPIQLFFSRRIGRAPGLLPVASDVVVTDRPTSTTILDAV